MPNIKSAKKRVKTDAVKRVRNKDKVASMRTAVKKVYALVKAGDKKAVVEAVNNANKLIDKAVKAGLVHKNKAARIKSKMDKAINNIK